jgi:hypothetical protein
VDEIKENKEEKEDLNNPVVKFKNKLKNCSLKNLLEIYKQLKLKDVDNVTQIISPLESLKEKIYNIDDELSNDQLLEISNNK